MSRKDYEQFAQMMRQCQDLNQGQRKTMANRLATVFALDNPNFDKPRFVKACGVD